MTDPSPRNSPDPPTPQLPRGIRNHLFATGLLSALTVAVLLYPFEWAAKEGEWMALTPVAWPWVLANVALLIPYGIADGLLGRRLFRTQAGIMIMVACDAGLLSLVGESAQLWIPGRESSLIDLTSHVIGGAIGGLIGDFIAHYRAAKQDAPT